MGIRGKGKGKNPQKEGQSDAVRKHANLSWSDCSPAFRIEAEKLMVCEKATPAAARDAGKLVKRYPDSPLARHLAGHAHAEGEDAASALPELLRASALQPKCLEISCSLASAHMALQQFGRAADECRRALAVQDPTDPALHTVAMALPPPPGPPDSSVPAALRVACAKERLRALLAQSSSTLPTTAVRQLCSGMTELQLHSFLKVGMKDVTAFFRGSSNPYAQQLATSLEAALEYGKATNTWQYWVCPHCNCHYPSADLFSAHIEDKHIKLPSESFPGLPKRIPDEQLQFLESWDPVPGADISPTGDSGCKGRASILNQMKCLLIHLRGVNALSVDLIDKLTELCSKGENPSLTEQLNAIASLEAEDLQNLSSHLLMIALAPADMYLEKKCDSDHDLTVHFRIEEETVVVDFGDTNANGSVDQEQLSSWLCKPVHERSWTSIRQDCITNGAEVLRNLETMITSLEGLIKLKCSLTENDKDYDYFDRMASIDVEILRITGGLEYAKKMLAKVCTFNYSAIIHPAFKAYLNAKMSTLLKDVKEVSAKGSDERPKNLDDSGVSQSHEQLQQDINVSQPDQQAQAHTETKTEPNPPTRNPYAAAHLTFGETVKDNFLRFLREFKINPAESSFYAGELKAMIYRGSTTFCVYYKHTEQYNDLAKSLSQSYKSIEHILQEATKEFIIEQKMVEECQKISSKIPKLYIDGLPPPGSIQALSVFIQNKTSVFVDEVHIHGKAKDIVLVLTELGRNLYLGFLRFVIIQHKRGKSWNGILNIEDLQVRNGSVFEISKEALVDATQKSMAEDFKKLSELLKPFFQKPGLCPAYFDHLEDDLSGSSKKLGTCASDLRTVTFHKYLLSHLALKSAMARGHLWLDLYRVFQGLGRDDQHRVRHNLLRCGLKQDWTTDIDKNPMLNGVYLEGLKPKDGNAKEAKKSSIAYLNNLQHLLFFIRHVTQHGPDYTKKGEEGKQELKNLMETDLIIAKYLSDAVMDLVHHLRSDKMVHGNKFADAWTSFSTSS